ncbi:YcdB/YcdC domain-containing protein [Paenibacillus sp. UNC451MF]|uniref:YcdB/YcdC domain-containing protein n=1 Tax=Paenibacillus sp. UNC451MF TaxID=1449063 RepID=UPI00048D5F2D|nr:YcdB/YcdC domain-containing protein [Paenibacillus sp. UNC451MF]
MKLLTVQQAIAKVREWVHIPDSHELISSGIYRNASPEQTPYYKVELEWNKQGEPVLDENMLVNPHTIRAELDALTGQLIAFYRHDDRDQDKEPQEELRDDQYETIFPQVVQWINKLSLPIDLKELELRKKIVMGEKRYDFVYGRKHNGIPVSTPQALHITLNQQFDLYHLWCVWDACDFADSTQLIPEATFKEQLDQSQLSLCYLTLFHSSDHPFYICREDVYDALSGQLVFTDKSDFIEIIDLDSPLPQRNQNVRIVRKPVFSEAHYDVLKLDEHVTDINLTAPHPFYPELTEEDIVKAQDIAASYLKETALEEPWQFAFIHNADGQTAEAMQGNQIKIEIHRYLHGIPVMGGKIGLFIDRDTWNVTHVMDALKLFQERRAEAKKEPDKALGCCEPQVTAETAWKELYPHIQLTLTYRFEDHFSVGERRKALLVYTLLDCDWICDAVTGELIELTY